MNSENGYNNSMMSLEEDNENYQMETKIQKKTKIENRNTSQDSFLTKFLNSISNIGKGLKNIMSIKINIEENDNENYIQNIYDQTCEIFNTNKEISLIDAPSFMEESYSFKKNNSKIKDNKQEKESSKIINKEEESKMLISQDKIKKDDNNDISSFNKIINDTNENEIINTDIIKNNDNKIEIKSILLNKKRERNKKIESIINEEEKNEDEDEEKLKNSNILKQKILDKEKSYISNNNNNKNKNRINSSLMSLSMKSLDNIKYEINQRREENLRNIEEMHKRNGLYYDYLKERQIREKILDDYYKEKAKRIVDGKLQMEMEKRKREEEFKKLKIKKATGLKYVSIQKKPSILSKIKSNEIKFEGKPIMQNSKSSENESKNLNFSFSNNINNIGKDSINSIKNEQNNANKIENNISDKKDNKSPFNDVTDLKNPQFKLFDKKDINENVNENDNNKPSNKIIDNKNISIFENLIEKKDTEIKAENPNNQENKIHPIFGKSSIGGIFGEISTKSNPPSSINFGTKEEQKKEEKIPLFSKTSSIPINSENQNTIFSSSTMNPNESLFFKDVNGQNNEKKNEQLLPQKKEGLFNQQTAISSSINDNPLFQSNLPSNNQPNQNSLFKTDNQPNQKSLFKADNQPNQISLFKTDNQPNPNFLFKNDNEPNQNSLLSKNNPFLFSSNNVPSKTLFGNQNSNDNNQNPNQQKSTLFGNFSFGKS